MEDENSANTRPRSTISNQTVFVIEEQGPTGNNKLSKVVIFGSTLVIFMLVIFILMRSL
jgi:hypothetical protein